MQFFVELYHEDTGCKYFAFFFVDTAILTYREYDAIEIRKKICLGLGEFVSLSTSVYLCNTVAMFQ